MFWESEEDTAADRAGPEGKHGATREQNLPNPVLFSLESGPALLVCAESGCDGLVRLLRLRHFHRLPFCYIKVTFSSKT